MSGVYILTVTADAACQGIPADLLTRSYETEIVQSGMSLTVKGNWYPVPTNRFEGAVQSDGITGKFQVFMIASINDRYSLATTGTAYCKIENKAIASGTLDGRISFYKDVNNPYGDCSSPRHGFSFARK